MWCIGNFVKLKLGEWLFGDGIIDGDWENIKSVNSFFFWLLGC